MEQKHQHPPPARVFDVKAYRGVVAFGKHTCPHTLDAVVSLASLGIPFHYYDVSDPAVRGFYERELAATLRQPYLFAEDAGGEWGDRGAGEPHRTVPLILVGGRLLGGNDQLQALVDGRPDKVQELRGEATDLAIPTVLFPARALAEGKPLPSKTLGRVRAMVRTQGVEGFRYVPGM